MRSAFIPPPDSERLAAPRARSCRSLSSDERFDRITRTVRRLLHVPIAQINLLEAYEGWFRDSLGVQLEEDAFPVEGSFCGRVMTTLTPLVVPDTHADREFADNPLVKGPPFVRSYVGWPLELAPGVVVGALCAIDTIPRTFSEDELLGVQDLAAIAAAELHGRGGVDMQQLLQERADPALPPDVLDPATGCWTVRGLRQMVEAAVIQARTEGSQLALCRLVLQPPPGHASVDQALPVAVQAQLLRARLPVKSALARLGDGDFCALVTAQNVIVLDRLLAPLQVGRIELPPGVRADVSGLVVGTRVVRLGVLRPDDPPHRLWAAILAGAPVAAASDLAA